MAALPGPPIKTNMKNTDKKITITCTCHEDEHEQFIRGRKLELQIKGGRPK
jgi:hypothetical protein